MILCNNCGSEMEESITEEGVYICSNCQSVKDIFHGNEYLQGDYQYIDSLFDTIDDEDYLCGVCQYE